MYGASNTHAGVEYSYNANGYRSTVKDSALVNGAQRTWYEVNSVDPRGNQTELTLYSGSSPTVVTRQYAADNGFLEGIHATSGEVLQDWIFSHDSIGNVMTANDDVRGDSYAYNYDGLNRLKSESINGTSSSFEYHANGNIDTKAGQTYTYGSSRPHAVTDVDGTSYDYDDNGNVTSSGGRTVEYTVFDKPHTIGKGGNTAKFAYGPGRGRFKQVTTVDGNTVTKYYVAGLEILHDSGSGWEYRRSIDGVAQETTYRDNSNAITRSEGFFYLRDHLGSVDVILNESGFEATDMHFGAWGERRNADIPTDVTEFPDSNLGYLTSITDRGFTGHEMLDAFGLIHMNGRVYDPRLGRFLSADPFVQFPQNTQSYNRYSYVLSNPLGYTDPSGYFIDLKDAIKIGVAIVAGVYTAGAVWAAATQAGGWATTTMATAGTAFGGNVSVVTLGGQIAAGAAAGASAGFVSGAILTGSLTGAVEGAFTGAVLGGFGGAAGAVSNPVGQIALKAAGGCLAGSASGGSCRKGAGNAVIAASLSMMMENYSGYKVRSDTADSGAVVKEKGTAIYSESASNMGKTIVADRDSGFVGRTIDSLDQRELEILQPDNVGTIVGTVKTGFSVSWQSEGGKMFQSVTRFLPGANSASVFHDALVHREGLGILANQATILPAFYLHYEAQGFRNYVYLREQLGE